MKGWLVYDGGEVLRNRFFIDRWMEAAGRLGLDLTLVLTGDLAFGVRDNKPWLNWAREPGAPDFAVMRTQRPLLSLHLEGMGIPVFNNARVSEICNDKRRTHQLLKGLVPMMDTAFLEPGAFYNPFPYPVVVKAAHGCGGRQVFLAREEEGFRRAMEAVAPDAAVVQPLCDTPGQDLRLYILGDRLVRAMLRRSRHDFRSNVGQGGEGTPVQPDARVLSCMRRILPLFRFGLVGLDFIFHRGEPVFNEIEDAVGTRMLYAHTEIDIAAEYLDFIRQAVTGGGWLSKGPGLL